MSDRILPDQKEPGRKFLRMAEFVGRSNPCGDTITAATRFLPIRDIVEYR
jgi:hypothetical protein